MYYPKHRNCKVRYNYSDGENDIDDDDYIQPKSPISAMKLGFAIEEYVIDLMLTSCCNSKMIAAKRNQIVYDATCSKCGKKIQIKTTSLNYDSCVRVTLPSIEGTCNSPVSIYKFQIKNSKITKQSIIYTPDKTIEGSHYYLIKQNKWGGIIKPSNTTKIKKPDYVVIKKINRKLEF